MTTRTIKVVPYDPLWPTLFKNEASLLENALGDNLIRIHHIGSTSVEGLSAKPIIDMIPEVKDIQAVDKANGAMEALGYTVKGEYGIPFRQFFSKENYNVHVFEQGNTEIARHVNFSAYLRAHPVYLKAYQQVKIDAAQTYIHDIVGYCNAKDALIQDIDNLASPPYLRVVQTCLDSEWEAYHRRYEQEVASKNKPYHKESDVFADPNHKHFILRYGSEMIGILHMEYIAKKNAIIHALAITKGQESKENEAFLYEFAKKWLRHQGKILI